MSSISTATNVTVPGEDEAVPTGELSADTSETEPAKVAKSRKGRLLVAKSEASIKHVKKATTITSINKGAGSKAATPGTTKAEIVGTDANPDPPDSTSR